MKCTGCYKEGISGYCTACRKKLFGGKPVPQILPFAAPQNYNLQLYHQQTRHLSISGVQLKYALSLNGHSLQLTGVSGEYILKPIPPQIVAYPHLVPENEHLTMQIAQQVFGIETAANALIYFADGQPAYITKRFDVRPDGTHYPQEDFAQLGGKQKATHGTNYKYNGTYEEIGHIIKKYVAAWQPAVESFFKIVCFNYLFSNGDAHLKNFSLFRSDAGDYRLTPAYDLLCTLIHSPGETDTALDLFEGDINTPFYQTYGYHGYSDFLELARRLSLKEQRIRRILAEMTSRQEQVTRLVNGSSLPSKVQTLYLQYYADKLGRLRPV